MDLSYGQGQEFVRQVRPMLERCDTESLIEYLARRWPPQQMVGLLRCGDPDTVKTALVCLGMAGTMAECTPIAAVLHDRDETIVELAEQALWSIWFRSGDGQANKTLHRAVQMLARDQFIPAIEWLSILALRHPDFAEVYNQRAMARFLASHYQRAIEDTHKTLCLNPLHFGAMTTRGHCHAARGELNEALEMYHAALQIHPRFEGIREALVQVFKCLCRCRAGTSSGQSRAFTSYADSP